MPPPVHIIRLSDLFMLLPLNSILPLKCQFPPWWLSSHLETRNQDTAEGRQVDYVNSRGVITVALDRYYSTILKTLAHSSAASLKDIWTATESLPSLPQAIPPLIENLMMTEIGYHRHIRTISRTFSRFVPDMLLSIEYIIKLEKSNQKCTSTQTVCPRWILIEI